jgi:hypothetical protein
MLFMARYTLRVLDSSPYEIPHADSSDHGRSNMARLLILNLELPRSRYCSFTELKKSRHIRTAQTEPQESRMLALFPLNIISSAER